MREDIIARASDIMMRQCGNVGYCTLAQMDGDGYPTAATISVSRADGIRWVAFCTGLQSNWARRARQSDRASVCFNAAGCNITLVGNLAVLTDLPTKRAMWYDGMGAYFSGPEDPGFCVLRFTTRRYSLMLDEEEGTVRGVL